MINNLCVQTLWKFRHEWNAVINFSCIHLCIERDGDRIITVKFKKIERGGKRMWNMQYATKVRFSSAILNHVDIMIESYGKSNSAQFHCKSLRNINLNNIIKNIKNKELRMSMSKCSQLKKNFDVFVLFRVVFRCQSSVKQL